MADEQKGATAPIEPVVPSTDPKAPSATPDAQEQRLAQLARKEKAMWAQIKQLKQEKAEWDKEKAAPKEPSNAISRDRLKQDLIGTLAEAGLSHEEIAQKLLSHSPESLEIRQLRAELAAIKADNESTKNSFKASQDQALQQAIKQLDREVTLLVDGNEEYSAISAHPDGKAAVVAYIQDEYQTNGYLLTADEAAKIIEEHLVEEALTLAKLPKVQNRLKPVEPVKEEVTPTQKTSQPTVTVRQAAPTITHGMVPASTSLSPKDRKARAIAAFMGNLKD